MSRILLFIIALLTVLAMDLRTGPDGLGALSAAYADDDDDDDDDDDAPVVRRPAPARAPAPPRIVPNELLTQGLIEPDVAFLQARGFELLQTRVLVDGTMAHRLRKPAWLTMAQARRAVRDRANKPVDFNHYYRPSQQAACTGPDCPARSMIDWPQATAACGKPPLIGMVDTGLNPDHPVFASSKVELHRIQRNAGASEQVHGTAVASLLVGDPQSRSPGLLPGAQLIAVDGFHNARGDERMDAFALIEALDLLAQKGVRVVNLSFAGPANEALGQQLKMLDQKGIVLVAAAGNFGPSAKPAYPAAYEQVIAVTAVDRRGQIYRRANRGQYIDLAAPGVDVWTAASVSGARVRTGTSYAAPFVTAAAGLLLQQNPELTPQQVKERLQASARDLGENGRDRVFGHGLLTPHSPC